jgi:hypothetical protein
VQSFSTILLPSHLTSCTASKPILYSGLAVGHHYTEIKSSIFPLLNLCSCCVACPVSDFRSFSTNIFFTGWGFQPHAQPPTWRTRVSLFVWVITFDLSGKWYHTNSVTTASTAIRIIWPHKHHHYVKVGIPSVGWNSYKNVSIVQNTQNKQLRFRTVFGWNHSHEEGTNGKRLCKCCLY